MYSPTLYSAIHIPQHPLGPLQMVIRQRAILALKT